MSEEQELTQGVLPLDTPMNDIDDEYEVITSEEVDRVLAALEELICTVDSENIRCCLEEASEAIFELIYTEEDLEIEEEAA